MLRQFLIFFCLSILFIVLAPYIQQVLIYAAYVSNLISAQIAPLFSPSPSGLLLRHVLILSTLPLMISGVPALCYWFIKKQELPHFLALTWMLWLVFALCQVLQWLK